MQHQNVHGPPYIVKRPARICPAACAVVFRRSLQPLPGLPSFDLSSCRRRRRHSLCCCSNLLRPTVAVATYSRRERGLVTSALEVIFYNEIRYINLPFTAAYSIQPENDGVRGHREKIATTNFHGGRPISRQSRVATTL